jgi:hypothetical protein
MFSQPDYPKDHRFEDLTLEDQPPPRPVYEPKLGDLSPVEGLIAEEPKDDLKGIPHGPWGPWRIPSTCIAWPAPRMVVRNTSSHFSSALTEQRHGTRQLRTITSLVQALIPIGVISS